MQSFSSFTLSYHVFHLSYLTLYRYSDLAIETCGVCVCCYKLKIELLKGKRGGDELPCKKIARVDQNPKKKKSIDVMRRIK